MEERSAEEMVVVERKEREERERRKRQRGMTVREWRTSLR